MLDIGRNKGHQLIGLPQHRREHNASDNDTGAAAENRTASGVFQVFGDDGNIAVAQGFQCAHLGALLIHHAGHGGDAHQRRHQQEEGRKHPGNARHNIRVAVQGVIADVGGSVQNIYLRFGNISNGLLCVLQFLGGFFQLLLCFTEFFVRLLPGFFQCCPAVGQLLLAFLQFLFACLQLPFALPELLAAVLQLLLTAGNLLIAVDNLAVHGGTLVSDFGVAIPNLLATGTDLLPLGKQVFPLGFQLCLLGGYLVHLGIQLRLLGGQL